MLSERAVPPHHIRSPLGAAAPISRLRRHGPKRRDPSLNGIQPAGISVRLLDPPNFTPAPKPRGRPPKNGHLSSSSGAAQLGNFTSALGVRPLGWTDWDEELTGLPGFRKEDPWQSTAVTASNSNVRSRRNFSPAKRCMVWQNATTGLKAAIDGKAAAGGSTIPTAARSMRPSSTTRHWPPTA